jgi:hypothetical protein
MHDVRLARRGDKQIQCIKFSEGSQVAIVDDNPEWSAYSMAGFDVTLEIYCGQAQAGKRFFSSNKYLG